MSIRPKDLEQYRTKAYSLRCGECLASYSASPDDYAWMNAEDAIVCAGCGTELALEEKMSVNGRG